jgi:hypothetical protein
LKVEVSVVKKLSETKSDIIISFDKEELKHIAMSWLHRICTSKHLECKKEEEKQKCRELYKILGWD